MDETIDHHLPIEIKSPPIKFPREQRVPFFGSQLRKKKKENTWVISLFVVLEVVAFFATMFVNNCPLNSHSNCVLKSLRRFSFQPFSENTLLGPSSSTLDEMGALQRTLAIEQHEKWRLVTSLGLHAGVIHLIINLSSTIFIGIRLEQEFGPLRIGIIYVLSGFIGSLMSAFFVDNSPAVGSSGALFGLLGSMLSGLIRNWEIYSDKFAALVTLSVVAITNLVLGLLPHVDNFSNIGGFLSGILLGCVLFFKSQLGQVDRKKGLFDYDVKSPVDFKNKLDKPVLRIVSLVLFVIFLAGGLVAVLHGVDANKYCSWCRYINCVPTKRWICNESKSPCEAMISEGRLTLTCKTNDNFRIYPFANISQARMMDLCSQICS